MTNHTLTITRVLADWLEEKGVAGYVGSVILHSMCSDKRNEYKDPEDFYYLEVKLDYHKIKEYGVTPVFLTRIFKFTQAELDEARVVKRGTGGCVHVTDQRLADYIRAKLEKECGE